MGLKLPSDVRRKVLAAQVGPPPVPALPAPPGTPDAGAGWRLVVELPGLRVVSEPNRREHWAKRHKRAAGQKRAVCAALRCVPRVPLPLRITMLLIGGFRLDDDNLHASFKAVRDAVASHFGVDDGELGRVRWSCRQRPGGACRGVLLVFRPFTQG